MHRHGPLVAVAAFDVPMFGMQVDYGGMQQYVAWANATGVVQQFYTDSALQVSLALCVRSAVLFSAWSMAGAFLYMRTCL